jgi:hypothetical protein
MQTRFLEGREDDFFGHSAKLSIFCGDVYKRLYCLLKQPFH